MEYKTIKILGEGGSGKVYLVEDKKKNLYAMKEYQMDNLDDEYLKKLFESEIEIMNELTESKNSNIVSLKRIMKTEKRYLVFMEYCSGGTLEDMIKKNKFLSEELAVSILKQIMNGLKALHEIRVVHRDIKAENILFNNNVVKIADFGFAKQNENIGMHQSVMLKSAVLGTPMYISPELIDDTVKKYSSKIDIWSLAVLFFYMLFGKLPFMYVFNKGMKKGKAMYEVTNIKEFEKACGLLFSNLTEKLQRKEISKEVFDFFEKTFQIDQKKRISWSKLYDHPLILKYQEDIDGEDSLEDIPDEKCNKIIVKKSPKTNNLAKIKQFYSNFEAGEYSKSKPPTSITSTSVEFQKLHYKKNSETSFSTAENSSKMTKVKSTENLFNKEEEQEYKKKRDNFVRTPSMQKLITLTENFNANSSPEKQSHSSHLVDIKMRYYHERDSILFYQYTITIQLNLSKDVPALNEKKIFYFLSKYMLLLYEELFESLKKKINIFKYSEIEWKQLVLNPDFPKFIQSFQKKQKEILEFQKNVANIAQAHFTKDEWENVQSITSIKEMKETFNSIVSQFRDKLWRHQEKLTKGRKPFLIMNLVFLYCLIREDYFMYKSGIEIEKTKQNLNLFDEAQLENHILKLQKQFENQLKYKI